MTKWEYHILIEKKYKDDGCQIVTEKDQKGEEYLRRTGRKRKNVRKTGRRGMQDIDQGIQEGLHERIGRGIAGREC